VSEATPLVLAVVGGGEPTPEELAALVTVLTAGAAHRAATDTSPPATAGWADRRAGLRRSLLRGPQAWASRGLR
jgi:hypothetical protein